MAIIFYNHHNRTLEVMKFFALPELSSPRHTQKEETLTIDYGWSDKEKMRRCQLHQ